MMKTVCIVKCDIIKVLVLHTVTEYSFSTLIKIYFLLFVIIYHTYYNNIDSEYSGRSDEVESKHLAIIKIRWFLDDENCVPCIVRRIKNSFSIVLLLYTYKRMYLILYNN